MSVTLQIKRSTGSTAPASLADGELAYTHGNEKFYIGDGSTVKLIGGKAYNDLIDHTAGTLTASSAVIVDSNKAIDDLYVGNNATTGGSLKFNEGTNNGTDYVALKSPNSLGASVTFTLPSADGSSGQFLQTNGSGELTFSTVTQSLSIAADSGSNDSVSTGETITFAGGEGIDTTVTNNQITIAGEDASDTNKGIASFVAADFDVTSGAVSLEDTVVKTITTDSGALTPSSHGFSVLGGEGMDVTHTGTTVTVAGEDASTTNKGVASFDTNHFVVTAGDVTIKAGSIENADLAGSISNANLANSTVSYGGVQLSLGGSDATPAFDLTDATNYPTSSLVGTITNAQLAGSITNAKLVNSSVTIGSDTVSLGGTQTDLNGITSLDVDNITVDSNTISTTDVNGDLVLSPNGTGTVTVPSGYESRAGFSNDSLVNKSYVDSVANGLDVKASCRVATTADLSATYNNGAGTLTANSNGAISVDGVSLVLNDRVLVKDQSTAQENGIYKVTTVGSGSAAFVLTRTPDANDAAELTGGTFTFVEEGTANADNGYVATHNGTPTFGTTAISFDQFSGAGQISAGDGLTKTGNTIDVVGTSNRISVSANAVDISTSYVGQSSITTLGTIGTGTWNGTTIGVAYGGTGLTSATKGSVLVANSANTFSALDGGGSADGLLLYSSSTDTISWATSIDGGTF